MNTGHCEQLFLPKNLGWTRSVSPSFPPGSAVLQRGFARCGGRPGRHRRLDPGGAPRRGGGSAGAVTPARVGRGRRGPPRGGARGAGARGAAGGPDALPPPPRSSRSGAAVRAAAPAPRKRSRRRRRPMAPLRDRLPRLLVAIRSLLFWSLVYGYCGLCASFYLLKLLWSIGTGPTQTFRRAARDHPPAGLNDPSLGTHCYVRIKVKAGAGQALWRGFARRRAPGGSLLDARPSVP